MAAQQVPTEMLMMMGRWKSAPVCLSYPHRNSQSYDLMLQLLLAPGLFNEQEIRLGSCLPAQPSHPPQPSLSCAPQMSVCSAFPPPPPRLMLPPRSRQLSSRPALVVGSPPPSPLPPSPLPSPRIPLSPLSPRDLRISQHFAGQLRSLAREQGEDPALCHSPAQLLDRRRTAHGIPTPFPGSPVHRQVPFPGSPVPRPPNLPDYMSARFAYLQSQSRAAHVPHSRSSPHRRRSSTSAPPRGLPSPSASPRFRPPPPSQPQSSRFEDAQLRAAANRARAAARDARDQSSLHPRRY